MEQFSNKKVRWLSVFFCILFFSNTAQAEIDLFAGTVDVKYYPDVAVSVSTTLHGHCDPYDPGAYPLWTCVKSNNLEAQVEFVSEIGGLGREAFGGVSTVLGSDQYRINGLSSLNAQITGQVKYDGTMYVFQENGLDVLDALAIPQGQLGTKVQTTVTVALVDVTDPDNKYEVGNTTVLDAECVAEYEVSLVVLSVLGNKCSQVLQPTYSFNAIVQPDHIYEIVTDMTCFGHVGSPGLTVVGCKYGPAWTSSVGGVGWNALGMLGNYVNTIDAIGRNGGLKWANSTISLGQDVVAIAQDERNRLIARLESTLSLITSLQIDRTEEMISKHDLNLDTRTQALESKIAELEALVKLGHRKIKKHHKNRNKKDDD